MNKNKIEIQKNNQFDEKEEEIAFNYFYQLFIKKVQTKVIEKEENLDDLFLEQQRISDRELLTFYHQALYEIGFVYATQGENTIFEIPNHPFAFIDLLLQKKLESPYRQSFLQSLLFILVEYIALLKKGNPHLLMTENPECLSALFITLDAYNKIVNFEAINMDLLEETKLLNQFVWMECEGKIGPLPKVYLHKRNDYR